MQRVLIMHRFEIFMVAGGGGLGWNVLTTY